MDNNVNGHDSVYLSEYFVCEPYSEYPFKVDFSVYFTNREIEILNSNQKR